MSFKKLIKFALTNYFITAFIAIVAFVFFVAGFRILFSRPIYVYAKVKTGQGFMWNNTNVSVWYLDSIKKGEKEYNLLGKPVTEILSVRYYPGPGGNGFNTYVTLRLKVTQNKKTKTYTFKRSTLSIGSPIELSFPSTYVTGIVIELSQKPFKDRYVEKTILLVNQGGYTKDFPYRYEKIQIGDRYFDGEEYAFEVLDKKLEKNIWSVVNNLNAQIFEREVETTQNIILKARVKTKIKNGELYYGEEYKITSNSAPPFATPYYNYEGFVVRRVD